MSIPDTIAALDFSARCAVTGAKVSALIQLIGPVIAEAIGPETEACVLIAALGEMVTSMLCHFAPEDHQAFLDVMQHNYDERRL